MAIRTVRLDEEAEAALEEVRTATGLPISEALKRGLHTLRDQVRHGASRAPYDIYRDLDLGEGGDAAGPSSAVRKSVRQVIRRTLRR